MEVIVEKYTDAGALRRANSYTTGHESHMTLARAYALGHSPIRTQRFYIFLHDIPLFVASQLVRSHVGVQWYQRSKRPDRGGESFREVCEDLADNLYDGPDDPTGIILSLPDRFDRYAPTSLMADLNAEAIVNISLKRLCSAASAETREIWERVLAELSDVDPDLARMCVRPCVAHGGICREAKCCGFNKSGLFQKQLDLYRVLFVR